jgi:3-dehydroquinate dehydratase
MAINPHDNYEKLAKLLYPSIEASGNVYYGQTRKLALDELFDKNKGGFHAHIESLYNDDSAKYETFFCWELGPLKGVISVDSDLPCVPIYFAKYGLNIISSEDDNDLHSGNFKTYKQNVTAVYNDVLQTNGKNPINNSEDWDGANFYISKEDSNYYIYIALKNITYEKYEEPEYIEGNELTFTVLDNEVTIELNEVGTIDNTEVYEYSINDDPWDDLDADSNTVTVEYGDYIKFRLKANEQKSQQSATNYLKFSITGTGHISISGDIRSLQQDKQSIKQYEFCDLFSDNSTIVDASKLELPASTLATGCYYGMFKNCTALINMPTLPSVNVINICYSQMFSGCTSLKYITSLPAINIKQGCYISMFYGCTTLTTAPVLYAKTLANSCYAYMFRNCSNLNKVCIHADNISATQCLLNWLDGVAANGDFYCVNGISYPSTASGIPANWTRHNIYSLHYVNGEYLFNKLKVNELLITSGTDSIYNGRGLLSEASSLYKYEKIFDENNNHKMNSYNNDGSFNQEIWGYKSFNSPVKFKNGIYGEFGYITDYTDSNNKKSILVSTCDYNNKAASIILNNDSTGNTSVNIIADHVLVNADTVTFTDVFINNIGDSTHYVNNSYVYATMTHNLLPLEVSPWSGDFEIGDDHNFWDNAYITNIFTNKILFPNNVSFSFDQNNYDVSIGNNNNYVNNSYLYTTNTHNLLPLHVTGDLTDVEIGASDNYWNNAYITNLNTQEIIFPGSLKFKSDEVTVGNNTVNRLSLGASDNKIYQIYSENVDTNNLTIKGAGYGVYLTNFGDTMCIKFTNGHTGYVTPDTSGVADLGTQLLKWRNVVAENFIADTIMPPDDNDNNTTVSSNSKIGDQNNKFEYGHIWTCYIDHLTLNDNNCSINVNDDTNFSCTYNANNTINYNFDKFLFAGSYKSSNSNQSLMKCPIGSIIRVYIPKSIFSGSPSVYPGETITINSDSDLKLAIMEYSGSDQKDIWKQDIYVESGTYRLIDAVSITVNSQSYVGPVLVQHIPDTV